MKFTVLLLPEDYKHPQGYTSLHKQWGIYEGDRLICVCESRQSAWELLMNPPIKREDFTAGFNASTNGLSIPENANDDVMEGYNHGIQTLIESRRA
jgi:hypothetical protein